MQADEIVAYQYDANLHCPSCTIDAWNNGYFTKADPLGLGNGRDANGILMSATDKEGNNITAIFAMNEGWQNDNCSDCHRSLGDIAGFEEDEEEE